jgi:hypothetical protein
MVEGITALAPYTVSNLPADPDEAKRVEVLLYRLFVRVFRQQRQETQSVSTSKPSPAKRVTKGTSRTASKPALVERFAMVPKRQLRIAGDSAAAGDGHTNAALAYPTTSARHVVTSSYEPTSDDGQLAYPNIHWTRPRSTVSPPR